MSQELDAKIREALASDLSIDIDLHSHEQPLLEQVLQIFRSRNWWATAWAMFAGFGFILFGGYSLYRFYGAVEVKEIVGWAMAFMVSILIVAMIKLWAFMEMEKYSTIREIKRLELRLALLDEKARD